MEGTAFYRELRQRMVKEQIIPRGVTDEKIIRAMLAVERHRFVPPNMTEYSYSDEPLPIGGGQTISQPYIVALMTSLLDLKKTDRVLEIGTGSGYQAAILSLLAKTVYTVEINPALAANTEALLKDLGYKNIKINVGDGYFGWAEHAPYDKIIFTCAPPDIPRALVNQLKDGGLMTGPVGGIPQQLILGRKFSGRMEQEYILPVSFVPMVRD